MYFICPEMEQFFFGAAKTMLKWSPGSVWSESAVFDHAYLVYMFLISADYESDCDDEYGDDWDDAGYFCNGVFTGCGNGGKCLRKNGRCCQERDR